jgi:ligand-binding sensor domain-containing protein
MLVSRDTVWLATQSGLWLLAGGSGSPVRPPGAETQPAVLGPVMDARPDAGALWVLTEDALYWLDADGWHGPAREAARAGLGRLRQLAAAEGQFWIAGERGVARLDRDSEIWTYYLVRQDIPEGPVRGILPFGNDVWIATGAGALRLRWRAR